MVYLKVKKLISEEASPPLPLLLQPRLETNGGDATKKVLFTPVVIAEIYKNKLPRFQNICLQNFIRAADDISDIFIYAEKMGRMKCPLGIKMGRIFSIMGRMLSDIRSLF